MKEIPRSKELAPVRVNIGSKRSKSKRKKGCILWRKINLKRIDAIKNGVIIKW